jgi:hypothetical protein
MRNAKQSTRNNFTFFTRGLKAVLSFDFLFYDIYIAPTASLKDISLRNHQFVLQTLLTFTQAVR